MRRKIEPLLCELHAHTTWSDGGLSLPDLVDLYGRSGFDVLCVTDHVIRIDDPWLEGDAPNRCVHADNYDDYRSQIEVEAVRARSEYDLLVVPGLELTYNDLEPFLAAHAVAVGLRAFASVDWGIDAALARVRGEGAATIAAHPFRSRRASSPARSTLALSRNWRRYAPLVDRWELFNRYDLFGWVAQRGLPAVASGDFHVPEHLHGWKTLLPCAKDESSVVAYLRSTRPAFLTRIDEPPIALLDAA
jgi:predicted metal-dependent phosphoesterase TrpH